MDNKNVHILVPKGFQHGELMTAKEIDPASPQGTCIKCKGTGGVFHKLWLEDPHVSDGRIVSCTPKMAWERCRCYLGQFWRQFHILNVKARLLPKWKAEIKEALEREKQRIISESGGSYEPGRDTFLSDAGYKGPVTKPVIGSLEDMEFDIGV